MNTTMCAVVPVYNEGQVLATVLAELAHHVDEVVCVDDGSSDDSHHVARAAGATVLRHAVNLGQGAALQTGFDYVLGQTSHGYVVTFDADGQHRATDAAMMLSTARERSLDIVLGTRIRTGTSPWTRRALLRAALWFSRRASGLALTDTHNGLRVLSRRALCGIRLNQAGMAHATEIEQAVAHLGLPWAEFPVSITYNAYSLAKGQSNLNAVNILFDLALSKLRTAA